jgi:hypothetical protein
MALQVPKLKKIKRTCSGKTTPVTLEEEATNTESRRLAGLPLGSIAETASIRNTRGSELTSSNTRTLLEQRKQKRKSQRKIARRLHEEIAPEVARKLEMSKHVANSCNNDCINAGDGVCQDGLDPSSLCAHGTDCDDCGAKGGYYIRLEVRSRFKGRKRRMVFGDFSVSNRYSESQKFEQSRPLTVISADEEQTKNGNEWSALGSVDKHEGEDRIAQVGNGETCYSTSSKKNGDWDDGWSHWVKFVYYVEDSSMSFNRVNFTNSVPEDGGIWGLACDKWRVGLEDDGNLLDDWREQKHRGFAQEIRVLVSTSPDASENNLNNWDVAIDWAKVGTGITTLDVRPTFKMTGSTEKGTVIM